MRQTDELLDACRRAVMTYHARRVPLIEYPSSTSSRRAVTDRHWYLTIHGTNADGRLQSVRVPFTPALDVEHGAANVEPFPIRWSRRADYVDTDARRNPWRGKMAATVDTDTLGRSENLLGDDVQGTPRKLSATVPDKSSTRLAGLLDAIGDTAADQYGRAVRMVPTVRRTRPTGFGKGEALSWNPDRLEPFTERIARPGDVLAGWITGDTVRPLDGTATITKAEHNQRRANARKAVRGLLTLFGWQAPARKSRKAGAGRRVRKVEGSTPVVNGLRVSQAVAAGNGTHLLTSGAVLDVLDAATGRLTWAAGPNMEPFATRETGSMAVHAVERWERRTRDAYATARAAALLDVERTTADVEHAPLRPAVGADSDVG